MNDVSLSKFLSFVLRHDPQSIGLKLDKNGWADISDLMRLAGQSGTRFTKDELLKVVATNNKKRFAVSPDGTKIRASQGHSISVDLALPTEVPPDVLYHGTATCFIESIRTQGLVSGTRNHVHLSLDQKTASNVGSRHGNPTVLKINAKEMVEAGYKFYLSENKVWLTNFVPTRYIEISD